MKSLVKICIVTAIVGIAMTSCSDDDPKDPTLESIAVTTQPDKLEYLVDDEFDKTGMVVTATYSDNSTAPVTVTDDMLEYDFSAAGDNKTVTVTYEGKTAEVTGITVTEPDPRSPYFGKWIYGDDDDSYSLTFSADEIAVEFSDGGWYKVSPLTWEAVTNTNSETLDDYPSGYKITGLVSEEENSSWYVGESFGDEWAYYIHIDGNSIIEQVDDNEQYYVFIKDAPGITGTGKRLTGDSGQTRMFGSGRRVAK